LTTNASRKREWVDAVRDSMARPRRVNEGSGLFNLLSDPPGARKVPATQLRGALRDRIYADELTWQYYRRLKQLRVCDALALHFHLDPGLLRMHGPQPYEHVQQLDRELEECCRNFHAFRSSLDSVARHVRQKHLRCTGASRDPLQRLTTARRFLEYVDLWGGYMVFEPPTWDGQRRLLPFAYPTPLLHVLSEATEARVWNLDAQGQFRPGRLATSARVKAVLEERWGLSAKLAGAAATILRPPDANLGRRPDDLKA
jgi:hypothetical protein